MIKYIRLTVLFFLISSDLVYAQSESELNERVLKNIIVYHIRSCSDSEIGLSKGGFLEDGPKQFYDKILNDSFKLYTEIHRDTNKFVYPVAGFKVFEIEKRNFRFNTDSLSYFVKLPSFSYDNKYLIAYNSTTNSLKFISGNFFHSRISDDFDLNNNNSNRWNYYLIMRLYKYSINKIKYVRNTKGYIEFLGYSEQREFKIKVNANDFDLIEIR